MFRTLIAAFCLACAPSAAAQDWPASHHPRPLAPQFEERFNDGWLFRRGIPVTKARETA